MSWTILYLRHGAAVGCGEVRHVQVVCRWWRETRNGGLKHLGGSLGGLKATSTLSYTKNPRHDKLGWGVGGWAAGRAGKEDLWSWILPASPPAAALQYQTGSALAFGFGLGLEFGLEFGLAGSSYLAACGSTLWDA